MKDYQLPQTGFLRLPAVLSVIPVSKSTWWAGVKSGRYPNTVDLIIINTNRLNIAGLCNTCGGHAFKGGAVKRIPEYRKTFNVQTVQEQHLVGRVVPPVNCDLERSQ